MIQFTFVLFYFLQTIWSQENQKCRVLVMEGGGDRGAYLAGAFHQMVEMMPSEEVAYDVITGISAGGLNTGSISFFEKGQEKQASAFLDNVWHTLKRTDIWQTWGIFHDPIWHEKALFDTTPLRNYLYNIVKNRKFVRDFVIGATNFKSGQLQRFQNKDIITEDDMVGMMMSTSAIPIVFPPSEFKNKTFVDGGLTTFMDVIGGIDYCKDKGHQEKDIIVDIIMCVGKNMNISQGLPKNTFQSAVRAFDLVAQQIIYKDLIEGQAIYEDVNFRHVISPNLFIGGDAFLQFDRIQMDYMYNKAIEDVKETINSYDQNQERKSYQSIRQQLINKI